jgi:hypothetical protein
MAHAAGNMLCANGFFVARSRKTMPFELSRTFHLEMRKADDPDLATLWCSIFTFETQADARNLASLDRHEPTADVSLKMREQARFFPWLPMTSQLTRFTNASKSTQGKRKASDAGSEIGR